MAINNGAGGGAGRVLNGRYQLISVVGGGGMAQVYKARDNVLGRVVAVKVLHEQYANDAQFVARFKREAQASANLAHPNIVNVYDVGQDGDIYFIVMEFIAGESLKEFIVRSAPLPADTAVSIAAQILAGLEYAHRSGLIHRDIKPQNVLITREGAVKVTDFGIAKSVSDLGLTEAGLALGTAHYFSPEQAKGERVVPQSDIYSLGVTLYEMLTGHIPFESETAVGLAYKHISEIPTRPALVNPNIPARLDTIVMKALAKDPSQRFNSAAEMEKALRNLEAAGQQATTSIPVARTNITAGAPKQNTRAARPPTAGQPTRPVGPERLAVAGAASSAATRQIASPLAAPSSMALRP
ncbi:MAG: protein kinase domain-containing protein, partial [Chloroflexia bacterium]